MEKQLILNRRNFDNLLILFLKKPILEESKSDLVNRIGKEKAFEVDRHLNEHTATVVKNVEADKQVWYAGEIEDDDLWGDFLFEKHRQEGKDLDERMKNSFAHGFKRGYRNIILMGSDVFDISAEEIGKAFGLFSRAEIVLGPTEKGRFHLLGLNQMLPSVFKPKNWKSDEVLSKTLSQVSDNELVMLDEKNDIVTYNDLEESNFLNNQIHL